VTEKRSHIVLLTDYSDESTRAFEPTARLAAKLGAKVSLLHVVPDLRVIPYGAMLAPPQSAPDLDENVKAAEEHMADMRKMLPADLDVTTEVIAGERIEKTVSDFAEQHDADFIALASQGRTALRRLVMGSVAQSILRHCVTPVIVFPKPD